MTLTPTGQIKQMKQALRACRAWHYAEANNLAGWPARGDLCAYSEHLTKIALGMESEFKAPPQMIVWPTVGLQRTEAATISEWVDQLIDHELASLAVSA